MKYETNIFRIENLNELSAEYILFEIIGLKESDSDDDFDINIQYIIRTLSYSLKHPVTVISKNGKPFLVVRNTQEVLASVPVEYVVKRDEVVYFRKVDKPFQLDFVNYTEETKQVIMRFLQFDIQTEINKNYKLWQPGSGDAFFNKNAAEVVGEVGIYNGFLVRVVELPGGGGFGLAVDITKKYIAQIPVKVNLTRNEFKKYQINKSHLVYQYGNKRYEIKANQFSDLNASQYKFVRDADGQRVTLLQDTQEKYRSTTGSMPPEVANLPDDASVLMYTTNDNRERGVIAGLCYKVFDTEDPVVKKLHRKSIVGPFHRRRLIRVAHNNYLGKLMFGNVPLKVSGSPERVEKKKFISPDILLGNDVAVSVRNTKGAIATEVEGLGRRRIGLLTDRSVGFYTTAAFEVQYFVVPQTMFNMYGNEEYFLRDLMGQVDQMHQSETGWKPQVIPYDNRGKKNSVEIGFEILQKIKESVGKRNGGYALVVLPSGVERIKRQHDELAALIVSECLQEHRITASVMHSETLDECYFHKAVNGASRYLIRNELKGKYLGYVRGVAINQVLLNNERWPYVLKTPLNADLTIGIDVKKQIAGFTFIDKYSKNILTRFDKSGNKEKLSTAQVVKMLVKYISIQAANAVYNLERIVIHRDGRLFRTEKEGIRKAIDMLKEKGTLPQSASVGIIEIPKHSMIPFRLFDGALEYDVLNQPVDNGRVLNPEIGSWVILNSKEAILCSTGREFKRSGSSNPLFVKYESGGMKFDELLEDLYYLSSLAYTKPDDCSRFPLTIKITDRRINNLGSDFDLESLEILRSENY